MQNRHDFWGTEKFEFKHFPERIELQTESDFL